MSKQIAIYFGLFAGVAFLVGLAGGLSDSNVAPMAFLTILAVLASVAIPNIEREQSRLRAERAVVRAE